MKTRPPRYYFYSLIGCKSYGAALCTKTYFKNMKLLNITDQYKLNSSIQFYKNLTINNINMTFLKNSHNHNYPTRSNDQISIPLYNRSKSQKSFKFMAVTIWNSVPPNIRESPNMLVFKRKLKNHLLSFYWSVHSGPEQMRWRMRFFSYSVTTYYFSPLFVFSARNFVILIFICAFFSIESAHIVNRLILFGIIIWFSVSLGFFFLFCEVMFMFFSNFFFPSVVC